MATERELIKRIDQLLRLKATGNANELANKLGVCERTVYNLIKKIKEEYRAPVSFDEFKNSYGYDVPGRIVLEFQSEIIEISEMNRIKGGNLFFLEKVFLLQNNFSGGY